MEGLSASLWEDGSSRQAWESESDTDEMQLRQRQSSGLVYVYKSVLFSFHNDFNSFFKNFMQRVLLANEATDIALRLWRSV